MLGMRIPFGIDSTGYRRGLASMRSSTGSWASSMRSQIVGVFAVGALVAKFRESISFGSEMTDMAMKTQTTVREFMVWRDVARDAGIEMSVLERALRNVNLRTQEALDGNTEYSDALQRLGLNMDEFVSLPTSEKMVQVARSFSMAANQSEAFADVAKILGVRAGPQLIEVLQRIGREGFEKLAEGAVVMTDEVAAQLDSAEDAIQKFGDKVKVTLGGVFASFIKIKELSKETDAINEPLERARQKAMLAINEEQIKVGNKPFTQEQSRKLISSSTSNEEKKEILRLGGRTPAYFREKVAEASRDEMEAADAAYRAREKEVEAMQEKQAVAAKAVAIANLETDIAEQQEKLRLQALTDEQKIADLLERQRLEQDAANDSTIEGLEAKKKALLLEEEIAKLRPKVDADRQKSQKEISDLEEKLASLKEENRLDGMTPEDRLAELKSQREEAQREEDDAAFAGDRQGELEAGIKGQELEKDIRTLEEQIEASKKKEKDKIPSFATSSLQEIGGGGNAAVAIISPELMEAQRQSAILREIANNTRSSSNPNNKPQPVS